VSDKAPVHVAKRPKADVPAFGPDINTARRPNRAFSVSHRGGAAAAVEPESFSGETRKVIRFRCRLPRA
jgi:hypothetical protein